MGWSCSEQSCPSQVQDLLAHVSNVGHIDVRHDLRSELGQVDPGKINRSKLGRSKAGAIRALGATQVMEQMTAGALSTGFDGMNRPNSDLPFSVGKPTP